ncbi:MAG: hypothetical protein SFX18_01405 [Pirellulales bacterium]|nr:hypothetical protein [Pirellulales bacterium]
MTTSPQTTSADSNSTDTPAKNPPATTDAAVPPADGSSTGATDTTTQSPTNPATSNTTPSTTTPPNPATSPAPPKPVEYQPLAEVRDEIRQRLAREKAFTEKERILNALTEKMLDHANLRKVKELDHTDPTKPFVFTPFAVEVVGQEMAIEGRTVTLVSAVDFGRSELAQSLVNAGDNRQFPLSQLAFNQKMLTPYSPTRSQSATVDFLFWKTDVQPERVPDWSESAIQQQVTTAWKMIEAKKLATQQAETWAAKARAENRSIIDLHGLDTQIPAAITVSDFAWLQQTNLTSFDEPPLYEITKVPGIDQAGETFMQTVFSLPVNGIGVTSNQPGTQVYIVQVTKARDLEKLREQYLTESRSEQTFSPYNRVGAFERVESERQLFENLKKQYGVQLTRPLGTEMLEEWKLE